MMAAYQVHGTELDSSHNTSSASLVPSVPYPTAQHWASVPSQLPLAQPAYELIQHRVFVGGFPSATNENELRTFFEKYGHIREAKVIRTTEGSSKGYGFVTFDSEEEAQIVRNLSPDKLEFKGRRLNLGPAMRRITHSARFSDFTMACPTPMLACNGSPAFAGYYQPTHPQTPTYVLLQPNNQLPSILYSPVSPQHQLQQQAGARYLAQNQVPPAPCLPPKQPSANTSIDDSRSHASPKQQTLQLPQAYYAQQPMTPMTPSMQQQQQQLRQLHQMQNFMAAQGSPYAHQPTVPYYAAPNPTDMTHYSQMAMPAAACYYAPPAAPAAEQQHQVQPHYGNFHDQHEQEQQKQQQQRASMWLERAKTDQNKTLSPGANVTPPASSKLRNVEDDDKTPKGKVVKRMEPRQVVKDFPSDPLTPEKQQLQMGGRLNRLRPPPVRYYRVPFDGNRGKSVSLPSSPAAFGPPSSSPSPATANAADSPGGIAAAAMQRAAQQVTSRSPRKSVVSLAAQMSQVQLHGSPNNHNSINTGYGTHQATTPTRKVALASGATAQLSEGAVVPGSMLNSASLNKNDPRIQQY